MLEALFQRGGRSASGGLYVLADRGLHRPPPGEGGGRGCGPGELEAHGDGQGDGRSIGGSYSASHEHGFGDGNGAGDGASVRNSYRLERSDVWSAAHDLALQGDLEQLPRSLHQRARDDPRARAVALDLARERGLRTLAEVLGGV